MGTGLARGCLGAGVNPVLAQATSVGLRRQGPSF